VVGRRGRLDKTGIGGIGRVQMRVPEKNLVGTRYHYQHRDEIEAVVQGAARDSTFDTLTASIGMAPAADRTLGGLCDRVVA
jgi:hypothetical protein